jgi:hypothetical protein
MQGLLIDINQLKKTFMKSAFRLLLSASVACLLLTGCSKTADTPSTAADATANTSPKIASGNWVISSYTQKTEDKTSMFAGVVFAFADAGKLIATQNGSATSGTWSYSPSSVGYYGSAPTKASITMNVGATKPWKNLTRTWNVVSNDNTTISLINPEPLDDEHIIFSKQ